jgi:Fe-S-cluster-containing dehydrogenase component
MAKMWNLIVDVARCDNCRVCFLAVKDEYVGNDFPGVSAAQPAQGHNWLEIQRKERGSYPMVEARFMPVMCNHCDDAPCMDVAQGAVTKRSDGIVIIDPELAKGQKQIVDACPYGAISWNEELQLPQHWIFDAHLLDAGWTKTRAEQCCPTGVYRAQLDCIMFTKGLSNPVVQTIAASAMAGVLYTATVEAVAGRTTVGAFTAFIAALGLVTAPLRRLVNVAGPLQQGIAAAQSIFQIIDTPLEDKGGDRTLGRARGEVEYRDVCFRYPTGAEDVLSGVSFSVRSGGPPF